MIMPSQACLLEEYHMLQRALASQTLVSVGSPSAESAETFDFAESFQTMPAHPSGSAWRAHAPPFFMGPAHISHAHPASSVLGQLGFLPGSPSSGPVLNTTPVFPAFAEKELIAQQLMDPSAGVLCHEPLWVEPLFRKPSEDTEQEATAETGLSLGEDDDDKSPTRSSVWIASELDELDACGPSEPRTVNTPWCGTGLQKRRLPKGTPVKKQLPPWAR